ncbi:hypothetical protein BJY01DRAFT_219557 [Aspergillus pseudoustus]|uniref:ABM domain-containing protein n=1 Tax=Aspergillus pseudoustus TaxID=1810923 RepID=A0ABR4JG19_9EURO
MPGFTPLVPPQAATRNGHGSKSTTPIRVPMSPPVLSGMIKDNMALSSWLLLGGLLQGLAIYALGLRALIPPTVIILYRTIDHLLMACGITHNHYMHGVLQTKFSGQFPQPDGSFTATPAAESIVVFHLGARINHPLGPLAPGAKGLDDRVKKMIDAMTADAEKYGVLGVSHWIKQEAAAGNEVMYIFYLRDYDALHRFAHDEIHMDGVVWWTRIVKNHPHIAIFHETYVVQKGQWENIYINSKPTGMGDTYFPIKGKGELARSPVDARSGALRSASKRLQFQWLEEAEKDGGELYDRTFV